MSLILIFCVFFLLTSSLIITKLGKWNEILSNRFPLLMSLLQQLVKILSIRLGLLFAVILKGF